MPEGQVVRINIDGAGFGQQFEQDLRYDGLCRPYVNVTVREPTEEELELRRQREEVLKAAREHQAAAEARSKELLLRVLGPERRKLFLEKSYIDVTTKTGHSYRIDCGGSYSGNVFLVKGDDRQVQTQFCIYPNPRKVETFVLDEWGNHVLHPLPRYDMFLGQMLLLETDEEKFCMVGVSHGPERPPFNNHLHFFRDRELVQRTWR